MLLVSSSGSLTARDLVVYDDGVEQPIVRFGSEEVPLDVAFVLDTSGSMWSDLPLMKKAALALVSLLRAGDRAAVFELGTTIGVAARLTADRNAIAVAVERIHASGSSPIYDGVNAALREFVRERSTSREMRRQALVLLSDGFDNSSVVRFGDVAQLAAPGRHDLPGSAARAGPSPRSLLLFGTGGRWEIRQCPELAGARNRRTGSLPAPRRRARGHLRVDCTRAGQPVHRGLRRAGYRSAGRLQTPVRPRGAASRGIGAHPQRLPSKVRRLL